MTKVQLGDLLHQAAPPLVYGTISEAGRGTGRAGSSSAAVSLDSRDFEVVQRHQVLGLFGRVGGLSLGRAAVGGERQQLLNAGDDGNGKVGAGHAGVLLYRRRIYTT